MEAPIKENFPITIYMEQEFINGPTDENTMVSGRIIRCMELAYSSGLMEGVMKASIMTIKKKAMGNSYGLMERCMKGDGWLVNKMVLVCTLQLRGKHVKESGSSEKE